VTINLTSPNFAGIVTGIGVCVIDALEQTPAGAPTVRCVRVPTPLIPGDSCDGGGQYAAANQTVYGSDSFPQPFVGSWAKCSPRWWVARVLISVVRCVPTLDESGFPPFCAAELVAALTLENDRTATRQAVACCLQELREQQRGLSWAIDQSITVGELGGCAGVETTVLLGVTACPCPG
jgi:hypothetical protein